MIKDQNSLQSSYYVPENVNDKIVTDEKQIFYESHNVQGSNLV